MRASPSDTVTATASMRRRERDLLVGEGDEVSEGSDTVLVLLSPELGVCPLSAARALESFSLIERLSLPSEKDLFPGEDDWVGSGEVLLLSTAVEPCPFRASTT